MQIIVGWDIFWHVKEVKFNRLIEPEACIHMENDILIVGLSLYKKILHSHYGFDAWLDFVVSEAKLEMDNKLKNIFKKYD